MIYNDQVLGSPLIQYTSEYADLMGIVSEVGALAFATDLDALLVYTTSGWMPVQGGGGGIGTETDPIWNANKDNYTLIDGTRAFTGVVNGITPVSPNNLATKNYVDLAIAGMNLEFYLLDAASGIGSYKLTSTSVGGVTEKSVAVSGLDTGDHDIQGWVSPASFAPTKLIHGVYEGHFHVEKTAGTKSVRFYWKLIEHKLDNSEIVIATSEVSDVVTAKTSFELYLAMTDDYILSSGSRVEGEVWASVSGAGSNASVAIYYEGTTYSRWSTPTSIEITSETLVPYVGAISDINLGLHNLTTSGIITAPNIPDSIFDLPEFPSDPNMDAFLKWNNTLNDLEWSLVPSGGNGDVVGPSSAVDGHLAVFDGTSGKLIKDGGSPSAPVNFLVIQVFS
jgi:hypothetical protein